MSRSQRDPLVAIVTPVYNGEQFLAETMECVQSQTYRNIVHCVLDNASTDATSQIIARFANGRVPVISARNPTTIPVIENWNAALTLVPSTAAYFRILSADDLIDPSYLAKLVNLGEQNPQTVAIACQEKRGPVVVGKEWPKEKTLFDGREIVRKSLLRAVVFPYDHCLFRYPATGLSADFFDLEYYGTRLLCTDTDAAIRLISSGLCGFVHEPLATTRWPGSVTSSEMLPTQVGIWSFLQLTDRWGPSVFDTKAEYLYCRNKHLRYYYLHLLFWQAQGKTDLVALHRKWLRGISALPTTVDYARALAALPSLLTKRMTAALALPLTAKRQGKSAGVPETQQA